MAGKGCFKIKKRREKVVSKLKKAGKRCLKILKGGNQKFSKRQEKAITNF
jgi:hypothetical protein